MLNFYQKNGRRRLIIFVHGFLGGEDTWVKIDGTKTILDYLEKDEEINKNFDTAVFKYYTQLSDIIQKTKILGWVVGKKVKIPQNLSIKHIGELLKSEIDYNCQDYNEIVLIAHSMGGLVSKSYILDEIDAKNQLKVKLFISLAVPHKGSNLAVFGKVIPNEQIKNLTPLNDFIDTTANRWLKAEQANQLPKSVYFQGQYDVIVSKTSTKPYELGEQEIVYSQDDHFSIVLPKSASHVVLSAIKKACRTLVSGKIVGPGGQVKKKLTENRTGTKSRFTERAEKQYQDDQVNLHKTNLISILEKEMQGIDLFVRPITDQNDKSYSNQELIDILKNSDLSVLYGEGGLGKSTLLKHALLELNKRYQKCFTIYCDAKNWKDSYKDNLQNDLPFETRIESLLNGFQTKEGLNDFERFGVEKENTDLNKIIVLDGLNEISNPKVRTNITELLFELSKLYGFKIIISSRYYSKEDHKTWELIKLGKIEDDHLQEILKKNFGKDLTMYTKRNIEYLSLPFLLDIAIKNKRDVINNYSEYLSHYLFKGLKHVSQEQAFKDLSKLAFEAYSSDLKFIIPFGSVNRTDRKN